MVQVKGSLTRKYRQQRIRFPGFVQGGLDLVIHLKLKEELMTGLRYHP